ncbi:MAG: hypothetical protein E7417_00770 [Ruminococcaceae bacterium]|nr:hypothetical protein [Oscillospiraceae bacterium]
MRHQYPKQFYVTGLMILSVVLGAGFFIDNHLDFIIAAFETAKFNVPNVSYAFIRTITCLLLPTIFIAPSLFPYSRIRISKWCFISLGILHLLTTTWIIYFFASGYTITNLFSSIEITFFQQDITNAFVSAQVFWDTYDLISVVFTVILSIMYILLGIFFDDNRKIVRWLVLSILAFRVLTPIVYSLIVNQTLCSSFWFTNNLIELLSYTAFIVGICIASIDDETWIKAIWDEETHNEEEF